MIIHLINNLNYLPAFISYCKKHGATHDESYIPDEHYIPGSNEPAVILVDKDGEIIGTSAIMLHSEYREIKKTRFRIFHCTENNIDLYSKLLNEILKYCNDINYIWAFLPSTLENTGKLWMKLGFKQDRYSFLMQKYIQEKIDTGFTENFALETVRNVYNMQEFCNIINICFADIDGHRRMSLEIMESWKNEPTHWKDGLMLLRDKGKAIGTVRLQFDEDYRGRCLFLESLAILPEYQGKGLGTGILRASYNITKELGMDRLLLTVNAENENAANLYLREGFSKVHTYVCYGLHLKTSK